MSHRFIEPMLVVSASHIPAAVATELDALMSARTSEESLVLHDTIIYPHGSYGWQLHVSEDALPEDASPFKDLVTLARSMSCNWILLDRDAEVHPDLPVYN